MSCFFGELVRYKKHHRFEKLISLNARQAACSGGASETFSNVASDIQIRVSAATPALGQTFYRVTSPNCSGDSLLETVSEREDRNDCERRSRATVRHFETWHKGEKVEVDSGRKTEILNDYKIRAENEGRTFKDFPLKE